MFLNFRIRLNDHEILFFWFITWWKIYKCSLNLTTFNSSKIWKLEKIIAYFWRAIGWTQSYKVLFQAAFHSHISLMEPISFYCLQTSTIKILWWHSSLRAIARICMISLIMSWFLPENCLFSAHLSNPFWKNTTLTLQGDFQQACQPPPSTKTECYETYSQYFPIFTYKRKEVRSIPLANSGRKTSMLSDQAFSLCFRRLCGCFSKTMQTTCLHTWPTFCYALGMRYAVMRFFSEKISISSASLVPFCRLFHYPCKRRQMTCRRKSRVLLICRECCITMTLKFIYRSAYIVGHAEHNDRGNKEGLIFLLCSPAVPSWGQNYCNNK